MEDSLEIQFSELRTRVTQLEHTQQELMELSELNQAVLNVLMEHISVIKPDGTIVAVNEAWKRFAFENNAAPQVRDGVGLNYLIVCRDATGPNSEEAKDAFEGIQTVLLGQALAFSLEYPCHSPDVQRWFLMRAVPLNSNKGAVVAHHNITYQKLAQIEQTRMHEVLSALNGLNVFLVICSSCKKVRDRQDQWQPVADYLSEQFSLTFSHTICPDCVSSLYPERSSRRPDDKGAKAE